MAATYVWLLGIQRPLPAPVGHLPKHSSRLLWGFTSHTILAQSLPRSLNCASAELAQTLLFAITCAHLHWPTTLQPTTSVVFGGCGPRNQTNLLICNIFSGRRTGGLNTAFVLVEALGIKLWPVFCCVSMPLSL